LEINGCTDELACNFEDLATDDDGSCIYAEEYYDCDGNCLNDLDNDQVCDELDNCPEDYNPNQEDFNSDDIGDACDDIGLNEDTIQRALIKIVDILGRDISKGNKDAILLYIYDDGSVEKKYVIEYKSHLN